MSTLNVNRIYSPSRFFNDEQFDKSTVKPSSRSSSRARQASAKSRSDKESLCSRSHTPESDDNENDESLDEYYPKTRNFQYLKPFAVFF